MGYYITQDEFIERLVDLLNDGGESLIAHLAQRFQVADSTVIRWANGVANPMPVLRNQIIEEAEKFVEQCGDQAAFS